MKIANNHANRRMMQINELSILFVRESKSMPQISYLIRILSQVGGKRVSLLILLILLSNLIEGIGLATILPVLVVASGESVGGSEMASKIVNFFKDLGIPTDLTSLCLIVGLGLVGREIVMFLTMTYVGRVIAEIAFTYRQRILNALLVADWKYFSEAELGQMTITLTTFTSLAASAVNQSVKTMAITLRTFVYLALVVFISGFFAFLALLAGFASLVILSKLVKITKKLGDKQGRYEEQLSTQFTDIFSSIKPVKVMGREKQIGHLFFKNINRLKKAFKNIVLVNEGLVALQHIIELLVVLVTLYAAVTYWNLSVIEMGVIGALMSQIMVNVSKAQKLLQRVVQYDVYFWRTQKIILEAESSRENDKGRLKPCLDKEINFTDVKFSFPGKEILRKEKFSIPAKKITIIFGPSGQGKTTITDLISRLYAPDSGKITVDGAPLTQINLKHWRSMIGYVPQEHIMLNDSILSNITFGSNNIGEEDAIRALKQAGAWKFVSQLEEGIHTNVGEKGMKLSGGQRQRLSIARGLVHNPKLLILDEITSALDPKNERDICEQVKKLAKDKTVIAITHRPAWLDIADISYRLENGKITKEKNNKKKQR